MTLAASLGRSRPRSIRSTTARHVIKITQEGGKTAEFEDRPLRFLVMDRNPDGFGFNHEKHERHERGKRERG